MARERCEPRRRGPDRSTRASSNGRFAQFRPTRYVQVLALTHTPHASDFFYVTMSAHLGTGAHVL